MKLEFWQSFLLAIGLLIIVIVVLRQMNKTAVIHIPRANGNPRMNDLGVSIMNNECPVCHTRDQWFHGDVRPSHAVLYCGNVKCRAAFQVENYGNGHVYAEWEDEPAPKHLY
jgi:hypothetical protein